METKLAKINKNIRAHPAIRYLLPLGASLSLPIPYWNAGRVYIRYLVYFKDRKKTDKGQVPVYPPIARISLDFESGNLAEYSKLEFSASPAWKERREVSDYFPPEGIASLNYKVAKKKFDDFYKKTEEVVSYYGIKNLTNAQKESLNQYKTLFKLLLLPSLRDAYRELSPDFFAWIEQTV